MVKLYFLADETLDTAQGGASDNKDRAASIADATCYWGIRAYLAHDAGGETEIGFGGGAPANPVAQVSRAVDGQGTQSNTCTPDETACLATDKLRIKVYGKFGAGVWALITGATFTMADAIGNTQVDSVEWTMQYYTRKLFECEMIDWLVCTLTQWIYYDTGAYDMYVTNVSFSGGGVAMGVMAHHYGQMMRVRRG